MRHISRYVSLLLLLFAVISLALSGCSRAPQAYFQPDRLTYERTARPAEPVATVETTPTATPDLTVSTADNVPVADGTPAWAAPAVAATAAPAIRVEVRKPHLLSPLKRMLPVKPAAPGCDQIVLRNGDVVEAKVKEIGVTEIRYKKCDRQDGPDYTISKSDVLSIKYSNGEVERFTTAAGNAPRSNTSSNRQTYNAPANNQQDGPKTDPFAIVAISAGGLALLTGLGSFLFGAGALVFGALSLGRIRKEPGRFKGKGLALAGMIMGIVAVAAYVLYFYVI